MAAARSFGSPVFVVFTVVFCHLIFSDLHQQLTKITARPFVENQTPPSSCSERKVVIQLGHLIRASLAKHGLQRSRVGFSKWSKHGQTTLLVAGHDPPIDITIYSDVPTNPGPQYGNKIESVVTLFKFGSSSTDWFKFH